MTFEMTSVEWWGVRIDEPVTVLTDLMVSAVCFYAYHQISHHKIRSKLNQYLRYYFLTMGLATLLGGIVGHGFLYAFRYTGDLAVSPWKLPGWLISMFSIALIERASIEYSRPLITNKQIFSFFAALNIIELVTFIIITFSTLNFFFVETHSAYGLLIVTSGFNGFVYHKTKSKGSKLALVAVAISAISALVYMNEWGIHRWFNHFDVSHIFMTASAWYFYRAAMAMERMDFKIPNNFQNKD
jgi:uncharacterized membrane protein YsdA (DUF1294 family)